MTFGSIALFLWFFIVSIGIFTADSGVIEQLSILKINLS